MTDVTKETLGVRYRRNADALRLAQKPPRGTAVYSRLVNRPAGRRVAAALHLWEITPNQATVVSALLSGTGIVVLATAEPSALIGLLVAVLLAGGYVMDSVDGQLARLRQSRSVSGEWLDHIIDCFKTSSLHLAVLISWYRFPPVDNDAILLAPLAYEVAQVVTFFGLILMPYLRVKAGAAPPSPADHAAPEHPLRKWLLLPTDYGFLCWTFVLLAWPALFATAYTGLAVLNAALLALGLRKWWGELRALDRAALA